VTLWLLLLLQASPDYAFPSPERDLTQPGEPVVLTDVVWSASETTTTDQQIAARARIGSFGFLSAQVDGELRGVAFETRRAFVEYTERQGNHGLDLSWRGRRLVASVAADRRAPGQGSGVVWNADLAFRVNGDLEILAGYQDDSDRRNQASLAGRVVRGAGLGALWQRGTRLELSGEVARERLRTSGFIDEDRTRVGAQGVFSPRSFQLGASLSLEDVAGRLARRQWIVETDNAVRLADRLLLSQSSRTRYEAGIGAFENSIGGSLTLFARRHTFPRAGQAALRMRDLAHRAFEQGASERRGPGEGERRAFRERQALSPQRDALRDDLSALFAAQVAERNVSLLRAQVSRGWNDTSGTRDWRWSATLGVPWRPPWPWSASEDATDFLSFEYEGTRTQYRPDFVATDHSVIARAFPNRELELFFRWSKPGITPADVIRLQSSGRRLDLSISYLFGQ